MFLAKKKSKFLFIISLGVVLLLNKIVRHSNISFNQQGETQRQLPTFSFQQQ